MVRASPNFAFKDAFKHEYEHVYYMLLPTGIYHAHTSFFVHSNCYTCAGAFDVGYYTRRCDGLQWIQRDGTGIGR